MSNEKELPGTIKKKVQIEILLSHIIDESIEVDLENAALEDVEGGELYLLETGTYRIVSHKPDSVTIECDAELCRYAEE